VGLQRFHSSHDLTAVVCTCDSPSLLQVERIIFCVFLETDLKIYTDLLCRYFPMDDHNPDSTLDSSSDSILNPDSPETDKDDKSDQTGSSEMSEDT
jgi:hypothetical protein